MIVKDIYVKHVIEFIQKQRHSNTTLQKKVSLRKNVPKQTSLGNLDIHEQICKHHKKEKTSLFCRKHMAVIFERCLKKNHLSCEKQLVDLVEVSYANTVRLNEIMHELEDVLINAQNLKKDLSVSRDNNNSAKEDNFKAVRHFRKDIDDYFDKLQRKVENEITQCHSKNEGIFTTQLKTCWQVEETALINQQQIDSLVQKHLKSTLYVTTENLGTEVALLKQTLNKASRKARVPMYEFQKSDIFQNLIKTEDELGIVEDITTGSDEITHTIHVHVERKNELLQTRGILYQLSQNNKSGPLPCQISQPIRVTENELHKADEPWKPRRLKPGTSQQEVRENDADTEDLYKKTRSILNKLTPQMFQVLVSQMQKLKIDTEDKLKGVIDLVFEKAISEPILCVAYANMCRCISMESKMKRLKRELSYEEAKTQRRSLGNIRFIGELFKLKMLSENIRHNCVSELLEPGDPESLQCLCKLLTTIGKELDTGNAKFWMDMYYQNMARIIHDVNTSARVRFMLQAVIDDR